MVIPLRSFVFFSYSLIVSKKFHEKMLGSVIESKIRFFDVNSIGRIINRFSKDLHNLDDLFPTTLHDFFYVKLPRFYSLTEH